MELSMKDELYARAIGWEVLEYLRKEHPRSVADDIESNALRILEKIQSILNDDTLDDPECFERIDAIVRTFYANGISTDRHDWG